MGVIKLPCMKPWTINREKNQDQKITLTKLHFGSVLCTKCNKMRGERKKQTKTNNVSGKYSLQNRTYIITVLQL